MCTLDKVCIGVTRAALRLIAEITCRVNYIQQVTNYWQEVGKRSWDYFLLLITAATFMTFQIFFPRFLGIIFPVVKEHFWGAVFQGKSYIGEINHLDFDEEKIFSAFLLKAHQNQCLFMSITDFGEFLLQHYDLPHNCYWAHEIKEIMIAFLSGIWRTGCLGDRAAQLGCFQLFT